jgi:hypothetical protein
MVSRTRAVVATLASAVLTAAAVTATIAPAEAAEDGKKATTAAPTWAPEDSATITPGVQMYTAGAQCTGNFVFTDSSSNVYVGYAAHCAGTGGATDTDGCDAGSRPLGTKVDFVRGGSLLTSGQKVGTGTLVYSSWLAMQQAGTTDANACNYNDFALVKVDSQYVGDVNPSVPFWGGPVGINTDGTSAGEDVFSYGNSSLRGGVEELSPKQGVSLGTSGGGWTHPVYTATPGVPGDSGSAFLDSEGKAVGTLSTLAIAPLAGSNGVSDMNNELAFAKATSGISGLALVPGTEPFSPVL